VGDQDVQGLSNPQVKVISVSNDSPASQASLKTGDTIKDIIVGIVDTKISKISEFQKITGDNKGKEITITVERAGKDFNVNLSPRVSPPAGQGSVGVGLERMATLIQKYPWYLAPVQGVIYTWQTTVNSVVGLYSVVANLFERKGLPQGAAFAGPLGITVFLANAASYGIGFFLYFIGIICVLVAIFNLFPIPALDGGKLVFLLIEKIKGKPVSEKVEQRITVTFFAILICLSIFITIRFDIPRVFDFFKASL
jgi:regulator of sigma E protease